MSETESTSQGSYRTRIGSYGIMHPLGSGGMSSVYRAAHLETGHEVALKVLPPYMARNSNILKRFVSEARSAEALQHPNIVSIYDRGSDGDRYYLVLEYIEGGDLHDYVQHRGPLEPHEATGLIVQVARGLEYAASRGVIHRDVKPSNLLRTPLGEVKITDLGLALRPESEDERVTREGTTVGTVDYMSPEQARDSRATSIQSDIYSLGCTFHYLLTGLPPFPGGDITEKLTKHARTPPPDVREVRPELPPALAALLQRMMAKRPEDRYASYRELLSALGALGGDESSVALVPIDEEPATRRPGRDRPGPSPGPSPTPVAVPAPYPPPDPVRRPASSLPEISLASLAPDLLEEARTSVSPAGAATPMLLSLPGPPAGGTTLPKSRTSTEVSEDAWILRCVVIGAIVIVVVIGMDLILRPFPDPTSSRFPEPAATSRRRSHEELDEAPRLAATAPPIPSPAPVPSATADVERPADAAAPAEASSWVEPSDPPQAALPPKTYPVEVLGNYLPDWARKPVATQVDGPTTVVRRAADDKDAGAVSSLRLALDVPRGVVELADVGPFTVDDLRVSGEARVIRSRPGYRATVLIEGPKLDAVRALPGVFSLDGRELTLDSLDLVVNVRDLGMNQRALFHGSGFRLTLRNCTVTIFNPARAPFAFLRADDATRPPRPSRVRIEDSLIRGDVATLLELNRGQVDVAAFRSILAVEGPLVRTPDAAPQAEHRLFMLGAVAGCRGPFIDLGGGPRSDAQARRLRVRAFDSVLGRFHGTGVASLTSSDLPDADLGRMLDWAGSNNQFAGWAGYFCTGPEHTIRSRNLAAFRSTWNTDGATSREISTEWPDTPWVADLAPTTLRPYVPGWEAIVDAVAQSRPYLIYRTLLNFPTPATPGIAAPSGPLPPGAVDLTFDADASTPYDGDLGAFLRDRAGAAGGRLRVRVVGSGTRRFTPVRLPAGSTVEIRVEPPADPVAASLVFAPAPGVEGEALIAATGGVLSLSGLRFRVEEETRINSLIRVDDGSLALRLCELSVPTGLERPPILVSFRAATTRPRPSPVESSPLIDAPDRPVAVLSECVLTTTGDALHAEVGSGLVALSRCILAARGDAIELHPARVSRSRFLADLIVERCTVAVGGAAVRMSAWPGEAPGPDRPWLVSSSDTAYVDFSERPPRTSVLCRADVDCFAQGQVFWSQRNDAIEVQGYAAAGEAPLPNRTRDVVAQWIDLWGGTHIREVSGPRTGAAAPTVRLRGRGRGGRIEATDLILEPNPNAARPRFDVGAPASVLELGRPPAPGRKR
ncbi:serine/threonine-protein kinase [Planctomyces sp. SH-PL62]|uniref:serine/threonine-protein kinase n=1 Tax=Planctomyces sp. SH-PL62 TaxID=1636152 RepID=UPI00078C620F|nr:serine/threonine-protein kinase [Planctomyces sp. SH-PL62]AMV36333.1 Serine/threonine-protein kinase PrkC [Planctomyces sp. SH-PL62]